MGEGLKCGLLCFTLLKICCSRTFSTYLKSVMIHASETARYRSCPIFFFLCCDGQRHLRPQLLRHREHNLSPPQGPFTARRKMKVDFRTKRLKFLFEVNKNQNASTNFVPVVCVYGTTYVVPYTHTTGSKLRCQTPTKPTTNISEPLRISVKYSSVLPDDGSRTIRNMSE